MGRLVDEYNRRLKEARQNQEKRMRERKIEKGYSGLRRETILRLRRERPEFEDLLRRQSFSGPTRYVYPHVLAKNVISSPDEIGESSVLDSQYAIEGVISDVYENAVEVDLFEPEGKQSKHEFLKVYFWRTNIEVGTYFRLVAVVDGDRIFPRIYPLVSKTKETGKSNYKIKTKNVKSYHSSKGTKNKRKVKSDEDDDGGRVQSKITVKRVNYNKIK